MKEWSRKDIKTLCEMWNTGNSVREIAQAIDTTPASVKMYVQRHRDALGLERKGKGYVQFKQSTRSEFHKQWHGVIPCGHWMITKQWSTK